MAQNLYFIQRQFLLFLVLIFGNLLLSVSVRADNHAADSLPAHPEVTAQPQAPTETGLAAFRNYLDELKKTYRQVHSFVVTVNPVEKNLQILAQAKAPNIVESDDAANVECKALVASLQSSLLVAGMPDQVSVIPSYLPELFDTALAAPQRRKELEAGTIIEVSYSYSISEERMKLVSCSRPLIPTDIAE